MRFGYEFRHKFTNTPGSIIDAGKKLLGYLSNQKRLSGVDSLVQRMEVKDEAGQVWGVEARFDKSIPSVRIFPPEGQGAMCEMYVESGMLDLGPNIASDAGLRFNRGLPAFDDAPATLYFGTGVDCTDNLNGSVRITQNQITSQCLASGGSGVPSRLTDPVKKQAQAALPASCWSGVMRRYVQAVYGGTTLDYSTDGDALIVEGVLIGMGIGLVEIDGAHQFIAAGSGVVSAAPIEFKSKCGELVYQMWRQMSPSARRDKVLTIALSDAFPGAFVPIGDIGPLTFLSTYGWQFDPAAPEAHAITAADGSATLRKLTIGATATTEVVESAPMAPSAFGCVIHNPGGEIVIAADSTLDGLRFDEEYDHPIHCFYDGGLIVVRYTVQTPANAVELQPGWDCLNQNDGEISGWSASWPMTLAEDALNCSCLPATQGPSRQIDGFNAYSRSQNRTAMTAGLYAKRSATVLWSTVRASDVLVNLLYTDDMSEAGSPVGKTWFFETAWTLHLRTYNLGSTSTQSTSFVGDSYDSGDAETQFENFQLGDHLCTTLQSASYSYPYSVPGYCAYRGPTIFGPACPEWEPWPLNDSTGHTLSVSNANKVLSCSTPCADGHRHAYSGELVLGPRHYLALPHGDSGATVAVALNLAGTQTGDNPLASGYTFTSKTLCNPTQTGDCEGTWTVTCDGYNSETSSYDHAPHDFLYSTFSPLDLAYYQTLFTTPNDILFPLGSPDNQWRKHRLQVDWSSVAASGATVHETLSRAGAFEEMISGTETPWEATENPVTCAFLHAIVWGDYSGEPIDVDSAAGATSVEKRVLTNPYTVLQDGFAYVFRRSLLGGNTHWTTALSFGSSVGMDYETPTGYPAVNFPSFIGWA